MSEQTWNAQGYQTNAGFVPVLGRPVLELLAPQAGEHILDMGCGDGALTVELVAAGATVVGIDSSPEMIASAREKGLDAHVADAASLALGGAFDAVFSNAVLHWVKDADGAIASAWRALRPGGRFVGEFGGHGNVAAIVTALVAVLDRRGIDARAFHPWFYPTPQAYRARLEKAGFRVDSIALVPRPTPLPTGMAGWLETFANPFLAGLAPADRAPALAQAVKLLRPALCDDEGNWTADYVRLRFAATRPD